MRIHRLVQKGARPDDKTGKKEQHVTLNEVNFTREYSLNSPTCKENSMSHKNIIHGYNRTKSSLENFSFINVSV